MGRSGLSRRAFCALGGAAAALPRAAWAVDIAPWLYQARTIVTGQREETRIPGLALCLRDVLVKVSGDSRLYDLPAVDELARAPEVPVAGYAYRDLYAGRPLMDEQGTRDRPYEMTVDYDPSMIDDMLRGLGRKPWLKPRPVLTIFLAVKHIASEYILSSSNAAGSLQREAFELASYKYAMPIAFPDEQRLQSARLRVDNLPLTPLTDLERLEKGKVVAGTLTWSREALGWIAEWRMMHKSQDHHWRIAGVNFDAAFRNALSGAGQILSGNGEPV